MAGRASKRRTLAQYPLVLNGQDTPSGQRTIRSKAEHHAVEQGKRVESANTLDPNDFDKLYQPRELADGLIATPPDIGSGNTPFPMRGVFTILDHARYLLEHCVDLVRRMTEDDYAASGARWSAVKKRAEMRLPDLKYVIVTPASGSVVGFISYMVTYEDGHEVLYVYEVHLEPEYQGLGLGRQLMGIAEQTARNVGLEKIMLTVFRSNTRAIGFYERLGYVVDEYSPNAKVLRNGAVKECSYVILSKILGSRQAPG